ncbi:hypothetical protein ONA24_04355 [Mycoplasmopsis cynos]|uniref:hypothetical protein n=1 Tax=Mycoplasmopsis cynos TaxID=171284 RepID=UPI0024C8B5FB|nr:hypothetical protein [Mycoplasmopsis cynos]WAM09296.1 hypothetical protein ONA24_04355 [Mycoplasmopsis cynos]
MKWNKDYNIPKEWAYNRKKTISYERKHYKTTYVNEYKKRWSGSFKTFMDNLISLSKDKKIPKEFSDFSYWEKNIKTELIPFVGNEISSEEDKNIITFDEVNNEKLSFRPLNDQPKKIDYNAYKFDGTKTIAEIENIKKTGNDQKIKYEI